VSDACAIPGVPGLRSEASERKYGGGWLLWRLWHVSRSVAERPLSG